MKVAHNHRTALLIIDMLNTFDFPGAEALLKASKPVARNVSRLKARAKKAGIPVIYVNDNFDYWRSSWSDVFEKCLKSPGKPLAQALEPELDDYFVLKPKHSGFYSTTLDVLLDSLGAEHLILTGIAGNICVLFTANDAHMRDYEVTVPRDCMASNTREDNEFTLRQLRNVFGFQTVTSSKLKLEK